MLPTFSRLQAPWKAGSTSEQISKVPGIKQKILKFSLYRNMWVSWTKQSGRITLRREDSRLCVFSILQAICWGGGVPTLPSGRGHSFRHEEGTGQASWAGRAEKLAVRHLVLLSARLRAPRTHSVWGFEKCLLWTKKWELCLRMKQESPQREKADPQRGHDRSPLPFGQTPGIWCDQLRIRLERHLSWRETLETVQATTLFYRWEDQARTFKKLAQDLTCSGVQDQRNHISSAWLTIISPAWGPQSGPQTSTINVPWESVRNANSPPISNALQQKLRGAAQDSSWCVLQFNNDCIA